MLRLSVFVVLLTVFVGCSLPEIFRTPPKQFEGKLQNHPINHVVIFAIDGLKRDTLLQYLRTAPAKPGGLHELLGARGDDNGVVLTHAIGVAQASTVFPSYTYPSWASMFTGVFPGAHGITGNAVFFRDRQMARYYAEYHIDAVRVQLKRNIVSRDLNEDTKTIYEYVEEAGGRSIVVYNMMNRGSDAIKPSPDTLWNYQKNRSLAVDENSLWDTVHALQKFNKGKEGTELQLPTVLTIYFSGLDHTEHLAPDNPEKARLAYVGELDNLIAKFIAGDTQIVRNRYKSRNANPIHTNVIQWGGLRQEPVFKRTLFVIASDHGHTPIDWSSVLTIEDLGVIFDELSDRSKRFYRLAVPDLVTEGWWSKIRSVMGWVLTDYVSRYYNVVATLNGGALGLHIRPEGKSWDHRPDYETDLKPVLKHLVLTLQKNHQGPEAVLYKKDNEYLFVPYEYTESAITLLHPVPVNKSPLNAERYPMAVERLNGLASSIPTDPMSAPDIVLLADRSKKITYANKQDFRIIEKLDIETHRHLHSDHGHLIDSDSLVPLLFAMGGHEGQKILATLCKATVVDVTPTLLDIFGLLPTYEAQLQAHPPEVKGHSLKMAMNDVLNGSGGKNVCAGKMMGDPKEGQ